MTQSIQIRIGNLPSDDWREDLHAQLTDHAIQSSVVVLNPEPKRPGTLAAIDPQVVAAAITGGSAVIAALIPVVADVFRKKTKHSNTVINVTLHGTATSKSFQVTESVAPNTLDAALASIGRLTEIEVK